MTSSPEAELSSIAAQIEELIKRINSIADEYRNTPDSMLVTECNSAERGLLTSSRAIERARKYA